MIPQLPEYTGVIIDEQGVEYKPYWSHYRNRDDGHIEHIEHHCYDCFLSYKVRGVNAQVAYLENHGRTESERAANNGYYA